MLNDKHENGLNLLYGVAALLLASLPATLGLTWLIPGVVVLEAVLWSLLAALTLLKLRKDRGLGALWANVAGNWIILPFVAFAGLSVLWTVDGQATISRWLVLLSTIVVGGYIGLNNTIGRIARILAAYFIVILVSSTIFVFLVPRIGVMNYHDIQGAWSGIFWHKNHMGIMAAFASIVFLIEALAAHRAGRRSKWWWVVLYLLSLAFVSQTDSVGSYLTLIMVHGLVLLLLGYLRLRASLRRAHYVLFCLAALLAAAVLFSNLGRVFGVFNKSTSLTGRVPMWGYLFDVYVSQRPVAGYGFNAFWYVESHRTTMQALARYPDPIVIADNGFIDILVDTGYVGLGLFLAFYVYLWGRSLGLARRAQDIHDLFPLVVMAFSLVANVTWSLLFENESVLMLTMVALMFCMSSRAHGEMSPQGLRA